MSETRYFRGTDGRIYKDYQLKNAVFLLTGVEVDVDEINIDGLWGVEKEIFPTVTDFIDAGQLVYAVEYYKTTENERRKASGEREITAKEAKDYVDSLRACKYLQ